MPPFAASAQLVPDAAVEATRVAGPTKLPSAAGRWPTGMPATTMFVLVSITCSLSVPWSIT